MRDENKTSRLPRREFLKGTGAVVLSAGGLAQAADSNDPATRDSAFDYDTLVIGGGFAGVTAARDLSKNGYSCAILEARNRLGGRTYYAPQGDLHVELGGTWIHWMQPFVWAEVMRYGLEIKETPGAAAERIIQLRNGKAFEPDLEELYGDLFTGGARFTDQARVCWPRPFDAGFNMEGVLAADSESIEDLLQALDLTESQEKLFARILGGGTNAHISEVSANEALRIFALSGHNVGSYYDVNARYQLKDGTISLIDKIVADGDPEIKLNTYVQRIEQKSDHVVVSVAGGGHFTAGAVVCTVPLNVLKNVEFAPPLHPDKLAASKEGHPGRGFKVYAEIRGEVPNVLLYGEEHDVIEEAFAYHIGSDQSLIACFGNNSQGQDIHDPMYLQSQLRRFLPGLEVTNAFGYGWSNDPFSQGTWCAWRPGWYRKYREGLRDGLEGRVFFASSDFCEGSRGYIDGAIGSGIRAAQDISELLA